MQKKMLGFVPAPQGHWVGDGFPAVEARADAEA